jgi:hypothetical protein
MAAEEFCFNHIHNECNSRNWRGYQFIKYTHETSSHDVFKGLRDAIDIKGIFFTKPTKSEVVQICEFLKNNNCLSNVLIKRETSYHSITIGLERDNLIIKDTTSPHRVIHPFKDSYFDDVEEAMLFSLNSVSL